MGGHQGILVASMTPLNYRPLDIPNTSGNLAKYLKIAHLRSEADLSSHRLIAAAEMDRVLSTITRDPARLSTDDNVVLEYSTPRGNTLDQAFDENIRALRAALAGTRP